PGRAVLGREDDEIAGRRHAVAGEGGDQGKGPAAGRGREPADLVLRPVDDAGLARGEIDQPDARLVPVVLMRIVGGDAGDGPGPGPAGFPGIEARGRKAPEIAARTLIDPEAPPLAVVD